MSDITTPTDPVTDLEPKPAPVPLSDEELRAKVFRLGLYARQMDAFSAISKPSSPTMTPFVTIDLDLDISDLYSLVMALAEIPGLPVSFKTEANAFYWRLRSLLAAPAPF